MLGLKPLDEGGAKNTTKSKIGKKTKERRRMMGEEKEQIANCCKKILQEELMLLVLQVNACAQCLASNLLPRNVMSISLRHLSSLSHSLTYPLNVLTTSQKKERGLIFPKYPSHTHMKSTSAHGQFYSHKYHNHTYKS